MYGFRKQFEDVFFLSEGQRWFALATGCFDALHPGHVEMLQKAGNIYKNDRIPFRYPLVIGLNSDASVRRLKGEDRPIFNQQERAFMLAALECVHSVFIFEEDTVVETLKTLRPAVWVKGGDRILETLNPDERRTAEEIGTRIVILPRIGEYSTTGILEKLKE
jgi:D-beta-D-heptose 7-phosphate kinase/D-beta-D-heptose 1-phosphate adenosyltransferase